MKTKCDVCDDIYERADGCDMRKHGSECRSVFLRLMMSPSSEHTCDGYAERQANCLGCAPFIAEADRLRVVR